METFDAITKRRCVRNYYKKKVPYDLVLSLIEAARWAPSSGNIQNTRFIIVDDEDAKKVLAKAAFNQDFIAKASVVLIVCSLPDKIVKEYPKRGKMYGYQNTAAAIQNILIAATGLGLSTCWVGAYSEVKIRSTFKIPDSTEIHALIPIGYGAEKPRAPPRIPTANLVWYHEWDNRERLRIWPLKETIKRQPRVKEVAKTKEQIRKEVEAYKEKIKKKLGL